MKIERILGKICKVEIKAIDHDNKTVTAVISHIKGDRDGDVIPPESMKKRIKTFNANPVMLADHNYTTDNHIGKVNNVKFHDDHVEAKMQYFAGEGNAKADWAWNLAQKGLAAYSIGFKAHDFDWIKEKVGEGDQQYESYVGRNFKDIELLEVSHVVVPANSNALQMAIDNADTPLETRGLCEAVLKGIKAGTIQEGPKIEPDTDGAGDGMDLPTPKDLRDLVTKLKELKILKDNGDDMANMQAQFDLMNKRIAAVETTVSQCESNYAKLEGMINDIQDDIATLLETQQAATLGPSGTDVNEDPANPSGGTPGKGFHHYSDALFGKAGSEKTKQQPQESLPAVTNRMKCLIKRTT